MYEWNESKTDDNTLNLQVVQYRGIINHDFLTTKLNFDVIKLITIKSLFNVSSSFISHLRFGKDNSIRNKLLINFIIMISSLLFFGSLLVANVSAFAPSHVKTSARTSLESEIESLSKRESDVHSITLMSRRKSTVLSAAIEAAMDPMLITMIFGAALLTTIALYEDEENGSMFNNAKSLITEGVAATKTEEPKVEVKKEDTKIEVPIEKAEPKDEVVNEDTTSNEKDHSVEKNAESVESTKVDEASKKFTSVKRPAAIAPEMDTEEPQSSSSPATESNNASPVLVKFVVKLLMPWKKFGNI